MTNFDEFRKNLKLDWVADAIENEMCCETCPAVFLCHKLYPDSEDAAYSCKATIRAWLKSEVNQK